MERPKMFGFQRNAVERMSELNGVLLFDDMGLGKTRQTIEAIKKSNALPALIIPPKGLALNWVNEIQKWTDDEVVMWDFDADDMIDEYMAQFLPGQKKKWFVMWHNALEYMIDTNRYDADEIAEIMLKLNWRSIVVDEAHKLRNDDTFKTRALLKFRQTEDQKRFCLTGTPVVNSAMDLYPLLKFLGMSVPEDGWVFMERFTNKGSNGRPRGWRNKAELMDIIGDSWIRRTKAQVLKDLPPKIEQTLELEMAPDQRKAYDSLMTTLMLSLEDGGHLMIGGQGLGAQLALMTRLRQLSLDPRLLGKHASSAKNQAVFDLLDGLDSKDGGVLIFSNFTEYLNQLKLVLEADSYKCSIITGEVDIAKRQEEIERFQSGENRVLLANMAASGEGLNLTEASTVIVTDYWWNKVRAQQAIDRAHRIGQKRSVTAIQLHIKDSIDDMLRGMVAEKDATGKDLLVSMVEHTMNSNPELLDKLGISKDLIVT